MYARLKGAQESEIPAMVNKMILELGKSHTRCQAQLTSMVGLTKYADIPCKNYSGGNKRKLSGTRPCFSHS